MGNRGPNTKNGINRHLLFLSTASPYVLAIHSQILKMDEFITKEIGCHRIDIKNSLIDMDSAITVFRAIANKKTLTINFCLLVFFLVKPRSHCPGLRCRFTPV